MRRRGGRLAFLLGLTAIGIALATLFGRSSTPRAEVTLTAGYLDTTRAHVAQALVTALSRRGLAVRLVETSSTDQALQRVDDGTIDLAIVSGAYRIERHPGLRLVTPLYVEALHLLVKDEIADDVARSMDALRGRTVDLGVPGTTTHALASAVLEFAGVEPGGATAPAAAPALSPPELIARARGDVAALPDAVFFLATVPSRVALALIRDAHYRLVPLPFAEAFRLGTLLADDTADQGSMIDRRSVLDTTIPAFTYEIDPPVPAEPLHTIGTRLVLIASDRLPAEAVERGLDTVFSTPVAQVTSPALDRSVLELPSRIPFHDGTLSLLRRDKPFVTNDAVDALSNSLSILGALAGGGLFLWQWWRQRRRAVREDVFGAYMRRLADVERRMAAFELGATLELEPLAELQRELLQLKSEALDRFTAGDLGDQATITDLLTPINAARDHLGDLLLHVRDNLEERATAEGTTTTALWSDAIEARNETPEAPEVAPARRPG